MSCSNNIMNQKDLFDKKELEKMILHRHKLQFIWDHRPADLTWPKEYLDIQQENKELLEKIKELNDKINSLYYQTVCNDRKAALILRDFVKGKSEEELANYIEPNKIYLSKEEILISRASDKYQYRFRPASYWLY